MKIGIGGNVLFYYGIAYWDIYVSRREFIVND